MMMLKMTVVAMMTLSLKMMLKMVVVMAIMTTINIETAVLSYFYEDDGDEMAIIMNDQMIFVFLSVHNTSIALSISRRAKTWWFRRGTT